MFLRAGCASAGSGFPPLLQRTERSAAVDAFHAAAMANGGTDDGAPGLRPHFGPDYYAAFVFDPEGWKLEVLHKASWDSQP